MPINPLNRYRVIRWDKDIESGYSKGSEVGFFKYKDEARQAKQDALDGAMDSIIWDMEGINVTGGKGVEVV